MTDRDKNEPAGEAFSQWFERLWKYREETVYASLFGDLGEGIFSTQASTFERFSHEPHPGWLNHGVFACPPNKDRNSWLYVTSGLSNPWNLDAPGRDPSGFSGLGFELAIETPESVDWPVSVLHNLMAYELLVAVGSYEAAELLEYGNRIPLDGSVTPKFKSVLRWLLVTQPKHYDSAFELASGRVDIYHLVGASDDEIQFARQNDQDQLISALEAKGACPVTDAGRETLS